MWPGYAIFGTYVLDGARSGQSTADIERLATEGELQIGDCDPGSTS